MYNRIIIVLLAVRSSKPMRPVLEPSLKHENTPQGAGVVLRFREVFHPFLADGFIREISFSLEAVLIQKLLGPFA